MTELQRNLPHCKPNENEPKVKASSGSASTKLSFPSTTARYAVGITRTKKEEFVAQMDLGVPIDMPIEGAEDVLILYSKESAMPKSIPSAGGDGSIPLLPMEQSVENCDYVNVILTDKSKSRNQCIAVVPQYESYHLQKWMRVPKTKRGYGKLDSAEPLRLVSRGMKSNGADEFDPPQKKHIRQNWDLLAKYIPQFDESLAKLKPIVEKVATHDKIVTVMVTNFGQSELLFNFVCAAKSRNLDISSIIVFATDEETKALAESLGLAAFYDEKVRFPRGRRTRKFRCGRTEPPLTHIYLCFQYFRSLKKCRRMQQGDMVTRNSQQ